MKHKAENYFGWYGVIAILAAYILVSTNIIVAHSFIYQALNLSGSLGIVFEALSKKDIQPVILNGIWAFIALAALIHLLLTK